MTIVAGNGHVAVLEYFRENRASNCKCCAKELRDYQNSVYFRSDANTDLLSMVVWCLWQLQVVDNCKWSGGCGRTCLLNARFERSLLTQSVERGYWQIVKFLAQHSKQYDKELLCAAVEANRFELVEWLAKHALTVGGCKIAEPSERSFFIVPRPDALKGKGAC